MVAGPQLFPSRLISKSTPSASGMAYHGVPPHSPHDAKKGTPHFSDSLRLPILGIKMVRWKLCALDKIHTHTQFYVHPVHVNYCPRQATDNLPYLASLDPGCIPTISGFSLQCLDVEDQWASHQSSPSPLLALGQLVTLTKLYQVAHMYSRLLRCCGCGGFYFRGCV